MDEGVNRKGKALELSENACVYICVLQVLCSQRHTVQTDG